MLANFSTALINVCGLKTRPTFHAFTQKFDIWYFVMNETKLDSLDAVLVPGFRKESVRWYRCTSKW